MIIPPCWKSVTEYILLTLILVRVLKKDVIQSNNLLKYANASSPTLSSKAARMSTWRRISFWVTHHVHARRLSSTCERWAHVSACPPESTWSSPPPLSPTKRLTLSSGSSRRNSSRQSTCPFCVVSALLLCNIVKSPSDFLCVAEKWTIRSLLI